MTRTRPASPDLPPASDTSGVPQPVLRQYRVARVYRNRGDLQRARQELQGVLSQAPDYPDALMFLAALELEQGDEGAAIETYHRCLAAHPEHPRVLMALGELTRAEGRSQQAQDYFERAATAGASEAWYFLADMAFEGGHAWQARQMLDRYFKENTGGLVHRPAKALGERIDRLLLGYRAALGLGLALTLLLPLVLLVRRYTGARLQTLLTREPSTYHEVARLLSAIRHEVLKHNTTLLSSVADRLEQGEGDAALYAAERLYGDGEQAGVVRQFGSYIDALEQLGRRHGVRLNLRQRDPVLAPMHRAMRRLERIESRLRRPHRGGARALPGELREISHLLNDQGYRAIGRLIRSVCILEVDPSLLVGLYRRVVDEPSLAGECPPTLSVSGVDTPIPIRIFKRDFEDIASNLLRNALSALIEELPLSERRIGLILREEMDPITGLEHVAIRFLDNAPRPLSEAILRGQKIERGLGLAADLLARHDGVMSVEPEPGWSKAVVVRLPRAEGYEPDGGAEA